MDYHMINNPLMRLIIKSLPKSDNKIISKNIFSIHKF